MILKKLFLKAIGTGINLISILSARWGGSLAFKVFATPPKPRIRPKESQFLSTAARLDVLFEGKRIAVYGWSSDPDRDWQVPSKAYVLLAYGWGYNAGRWRYFVPPLIDAGLDVIAYDPIGHGNSDGGYMTYPKMVRMQTQLIEQFGRAKYFLGHSFGGGGLIGTMGALSPDLRPERVCLMGVFSDARWIFHNFRKAIGMTRYAYAGMVQKVRELTGQRLSSFDNAVIAGGLEQVEALILHDPDDSIVSMSNSIRNHTYWRGSWLYEAKGAGHHFGSAAITQLVMDWLLKGSIPRTAVQSPGFPAHTHELHTYFIPVEQDYLHGAMRSGYYA